MVYTQAKLVGFTTTPLVPATETSFWKSHSVTRAQSTDAQNLSCLIAGNHGQQVEQPRVALDAFGNQMMVGGSHRYQAAATSDPQGTGTDAPEQYSATNLPPALDVAIEAERPTRAQTREGYKAFLALPNNDKESFLRSDAFRDHSSQFFRDCFQCGTLAPILCIKNKKAFSNMRWLFTKTCSRSEIPTELVVAAALLGGDLSRPAIAHLTKRNEWAGVIEILKHVSDDQEAVVNTLLAETKLTLGPQVRPDVWNTARSVLPTGAWITRWHVEQRIQERITERRGFAGLRRANLSNIRTEKLTREGAVRTLRNNHPNSKDTKKAANEIVKLPTKIIMQLLDEVVRIHPSRPLRTAVQKKIASLNFSPEVYEAAAMIDGKGVSLVFKKLIDSGAWMEVNNILLSSDTRSREDLAWILWKARKKTPPHVAKRALQTLPPLAFLWKSLMSKLI